MIYGCSIQMNTTFSVYEHLPENAIYVFGEWAAHKKKNPVTRDCSERCPRHPPPPALFRPHV